MSDDDPSAVLKALNRLIRISLGQHIPGSSTDDGLDVGLCAVNPKERPLIFAGARIGVFCRPGPVGLSRSENDLTLRYYQITLLHHSEHNGNRCQGAV